MKKGLRTLDIRLVSTAAAILLALPLGWKEFTGIFNWLSPFIMLNSVALLKSVVWLNGLGLAVLIISIFRKRWFCRTLCPVGLGCDTFSGLSRRKHFSLQRIPRIGRWLALISLGAALTGIPLFMLLDPMTIFHGFFSAFSKPVSLVVILSFLGLPLLLIIHLFFPGIWCTRICPLGGLQDEAAGLKKFIIRNKIPESEKVKTSDTGRRLFIAGGTGLLVGLIIPRWLRFSDANYFRPPASISPELFNTLCIRCGNCIKACPTNIIVHHTKTDDLTAWMTPELSFDNKGYCLEDCNLCGTVCPSGSISPFSVAAKKELFMGSIQIGLDKCLLTQRTECDRCKAVCHYQAIEIVPAEQSLTMKPVVDLKKCVGCGACAAVCPPETIAMVCLGEVQLRE
jgi:ferredoxin-type protein NapF